MASLRIRPTLSFVVTILGAILIVTYLTSPSTISISASTAAAFIKMASSADANPINGLVVSLSQASTSPPTVRVTVTNKNSHPVTIVPYSSPLDGIALGLGLLTITPSGADEPLKLQKIMASRIWPPRPDDLIGLGAGSSDTNDLVLKSPTVPMEKLGKKATVFLEGSWMGVFGRAKDKVKPSDLEHMRSQPGAFTGDFKTDSIEIMID